MAEMKGRDEISFEIKEHIGVIGVSENGWKKEVNVVSWNDRPAKIDIRDWDPGHERMSRGITLTEDQAMEMTKALVQRYRARAEQAKAAPARDECAR